MVSRRNLKMCLLVVILVMVTVQFCNVVTFWKPNVDVNDQSVNVKVRRQLRSNSQIKNHTGSKEVSSVRLRVTEDGQIRFVIPSKLYSEYWTALEVEILAKMAYDDALAVALPVVNEHIDRRVKRLFIPYPGQSFLNQSMDLALLKQIDSWPELQDSLEPGSIPQILQYLRTVKIHQVSESRRGTQLKLELVLDGGRTGFFKPAWYRGRDTVVRGDPYGGKDRHYGEIAAFYLAQILGYKTGPLVVGRKVRWNTEVLPRSTPLLNSTLYRNPDGQWCFRGSCYYCKGPDATPLCSGDGTVTGALVLLMSSRLKSYAHPWRHTYVKDQFGDWERNASFCQGIFEKVETSQRNEFLLDIVAISVFDFLIGNGDRHHLDLFTKKSTVGGHLRGMALLDNGKSFGDPDEDYYDILAPLYQCCIIRHGLYSTLRKLRGRVGITFGSVTKLDPESPLLTPNHLKAIDRRLKIVIATIEVCHDRVGKRAKVILQ